MKSQPLEHSITKIGFIRFASALILGKEAGCLFYFSSHRVAAVLPPILSKEAGCLFYIPYHRVAAALPIDFQRARINK